ncbi:hypothetical protein CXB51_035859 [Gossypium anomalum]|uniref:Phorbol-ester/DAG-type domain-containing protein n=1 Tax=Gossypium anomalum TaxID=47600 RepID=A0A8J5XZL7_9ROSI|nr:hypothetical protein CXB51_035859 [Gossypium anomalum]
MRWCEGCLGSLTSPTYESRGSMFLSSIPSYHLHRAFGSSCFVCFKTIASNFVYKCKLSCWFQTHVECALKPMVEYSDEECTIQHFTHAHPLKLVDSNQKDEVICSICEELCSSSSASSSTYGCMECKFFLHKSCMKSIPRKLTNHYIHPCTLIFITDPYVSDECGFCVQLWTMCIRSPCQMCLFPTIDSEDAKEIQHFTHPHTLALVQNDKEYGSKPRCVACAQICLAPAPTFRCSRSCNHFFLHKSCDVKLFYNSVNFKHPFHPEHPLTIKSPPYNDHICYTSVNFKHPFYPEHPLIIKSLPYNDHIRTCDACCRGIDSTLLTYSCRKSECKFNFHLDCYKLLPSITFSGHQHLLTLLEKTPDLSCHLCFVNCCNFVLRYVPCDINMHLQCLPSAPKKLQHKSHLHPLILTKSPFEYELTSYKEEDGFYCDVCEQKRNQKELIYYCAECKFIAEGKCVLSEVLLEGIPKDNTAGTEIQKWHVKILHEKCTKLRERREELEAKMKQLKGELDDIQNFHFNQQYRNVGGFNNIMEIQHVIHPHLLSLSFIKEGRGIHRCRGCERVLSGPTYGCKPCRFFVHKSCLDEHKAEVQSFFHPCPLTISPPMCAFNSYCFVCFKNISTSDFSYKCKLNCWFETHVECALKPIIEYSDEECTIQHFTHAHPLKLVDSNQKDEVICSIFEELCSSSSSSTSTYGCMGCELFLHKSCMKSIPRQLINHRIHTCTLIFITDPYGYFKCDCCGGRIVSRMKFSCGACDFDLHVKCALFPTIDSEDAKEIQHFCHPHTLALVQNEEEYGNEPRCVACALICLAPAPTFRCSRSCSHFFLHKSCYVKLPYKSYTIKHPSHPDHPLTITSLPYNDHIRSCDACSRGIDSTLLAYSCREYECKFNLHLDCYKVLASITFSGHEHPLTLFEKINDVTCQFCVVNSGNLVLRCMPCDINIHLQCLPSAPKTIKHKSHLHPLTLTKSPFEYELNSDKEDDEFYCDVCEQKRNQKELIYYCVECKFIAEVKCVLYEVLLLIYDNNSFEKEIPKGDVSQKVEFYPEIQKWHVENLLLKRIKLHEGKQELEAKMKQLKGELDGVEIEIRKTEGILGNLVGGDSELLIELVKNNSQLRDLLNDAGNQGLRIDLSRMEIQHVIHRHPLSLSFIEEGSTIARCKGCERKLSGLTYGCEPCRFFIHKSCLDEHKAEVQCFFHPCPLTISPGGYRRCFVCFKLITSNFSYKCKLSCRFRAHVECALKPMVEYSNEEYTIQHFTHLHPLKLVDSNQKHTVICSFCEELCPSSSSTYGCMECKFFLHKSCMKSFPRQLINHRIHPCTLIFITFLDEYGSEPRCVACAEICLPPTPTFRCSRSCSHFFLHQSCSVKLPYKSYKIKHPFHPSHLLTITSLPYNDHIRTCDVCFRGIDSTLLAYSCRESECKFNLHFDCYKMLPYITFSDHKHLLTLLEKTANVTCHLCGFNCRNFVLRCVPCDINIHIQCLPLAPKTIKHKSHLHPLTLTKSPFEYELNSDEEDDEFYCDVCEQKRNQRELIYYCAECKFIAEAKCVISEVLQLLSKDESFDEGITKDSVTQAIIQNWHAENLQQKHIKLRERRKELKAKIKELKGELDDIQHVIHHHPCHRHSFKRGIERNGAEDVGGFHPAQLMVANVVAVLFINLVLMSKEQRFNVSFIHALLPSPLNLLVVPILFQTHVECALKPMVEYSNEEYTIQHFTHLHPLKLVDSNYKDEVICSICEGPCSSSSSSTYGCMECEVFLCMKSIPLQFINHRIHPCTLKFISSKRKMEIQHVIHHHPLSFIEEGSTITDCQGCWRNLSGPAYGCERCGYFIHKSCLDEHKAEVQSFFHSCPLTISTADTCAHCFVCFKYIISNFFYRCKLSCRFEMHVECALRPMVEYSDEESTIQHFTHLHPLKLVDSNQKDEVICSICEEIRSSSSSSTYGCMEYRFFLHKSCMKSFPRCGACDLNLHVKCALFLTIDSEDAKEIQHFSHPHTLALVQNDEEYGSEHHCVACAQICLASAPTFKCSRSCDHFFLHKSCYVKLPYNPVNFKHPFHPKHLLTITSLPYNDHICTCDACFRGIDSTLLAYSCRESECKFNLHLDCYNQLSSITFRGHQHLLTLLEKTPDVTCHLCGVNCRNFVLRCVPCDINIHLQCLPSAPKTIKHKSHLHPLILTKSPFEYELNSYEEEDEFYCDVCEQKRNQRELIYYCAECKFIAEIKCVLAEYINLHERREELEAKMKELKGELDDVTKEIETTKDLLGIITPNECRFNMSAIDTPRHMVANVVAVLFINLVLMSTKQRFKVSFIHALLPSPLIRMLFQMHVKCALKPMAEYSDEYTIQHFTHLHPLKLVLSFLYEDNSFEKRILKDYCIKLEVKMKQLQGEMDGVRNEMKKTKGILGNLVRDSSEFLIELVENNSQLRDLFNSGKNQCLMIICIGGNRKRWYERKKIQHVIHRLPLSFIEEWIRMRWCEGCLGSLTGPTYGCISCEYFIHESCLDEHKAEVQSFFHPFPLTIPTRAFGSSCFVCFKTIASNFVYKCKLSCWFQTHVECAQKPMEFTIRHFTHAHPLKLVDSNQKDEVICSICEELCSSYSYSSSTYGCMECKFFLHKSFMKSIPQKLTNHYIHPCTLIFITDPYVSDECGFCGERIVPGMKFSCGPCVFDLHVKCALFPTIDSEDAKEIQHFTHPHTLALVQNNEEYGSEPRSVACAQICLAPAPTFKCSRSCNHFFLHKSCGVKLFYNSVNFNHPFHPEHPLTIKALPYNDHISTCDACCRGIDSTLLTYSCWKSECKFNLHLDCYKLLPSITFSGHQHLLTLLEKTPDLFCHLCFVNCCNLVLRCVPCDINMHLQCLPSAPKKIQHKYHLHPLILTKSPFEYELTSYKEEDEFYCDVCEQKRNQKELIYYCPECKFIAEVKCVLSEVSIFFLLFNLNI